MNQVIRITDVTLEDFCETLCYMEPNCVSYNIMTNGETGEHKCELNNVTHEGREKDLVNNSNYIHRGTKNACLNNRCKNNATCQTGFTERGYRCSCDAGFEGQDCERGQSFSCKDIYTKSISQGNKAYFLEMDSGKVLVYCQMTSSGLGACGGGGWTLVMKIDGTKQTFHYTSHLWSTKLDFNLPGGKTGLDTQETKLPSYRNTLFSKICVGMRIGSQTNFIDIYKQANSPYSLIPDGQYRNTSLGRDTWKMLIGSQASLQPDCYLKGFNVKGGLPNRARIGILGNNGHDCATCDSRIGFGSGGYPDTPNTCGNVARQGGDNGK